MFKTWLDQVVDESQHSRYFMEPGKAVEPDYKEHFLKDGTRELRQDGQRNTFDEIQSHRDSVDINLIVKRYMQGDFSVLDVNSPLYIDVTQFPQTLAESLELQRAAERYFFSLDPDVRAGFNNSPVQFLNSYFENDGKVPGQDPVQVDPSAVVSQTAASVVGGLNNGES